MVCDEGPRALNGPILFQHQLQFFQTVDAVLEQGKNAASYCAAHRCLAGVNPKFGAMVVQSCSQERQLCWICSDRGWHRNSPVRGQKLERRILFSLFVKTVLHIRRCAFASRKPFTILDLVHIGSRDHQEGPAKHNLKKRRLSGQKASVPWEAVVGQPLDGGMFVRQNHYLANVFQAY